LQAVGVAAQRALGDRPILIPVADDVQVEAPVFSKISKPWNFADGPIWITSKVPFPVPPSRNVSIPAPASTLPLIDAVG